jgi:hypothetical protein
VKRRKQRQAKKHQPRFSDSLLTHFREFIPGVNMRREAIPQLPSQRRAARRLRLGRDRGQRVIGPVSLADLDGNEVECISPATDSKPVSRQRRAQRPPTTPLLDGVAMNASVRTKYTSPDSRVLATLTDPRSTHNGSGLYRAIGPGTTNISYSECPANPQIMRPCLGFNVPVTVVAQSG